MGASTPGAEIEAALGVLLLRSTRARLYDGLVAGIDGVDPTSYPVLSGLARSGPASASTLAAAIGLDRTATTRYASRLQRAGLLRRIPDPHDSRATLLVPTERGDRVIAELRTRLAATVDQLLADWEPGASARFAADLRRFADHLGAPTSRPDPAGPAL